VKKAAPLALGLLACALPAALAEDPIDRLDEALTFASRDGQIRARLSGLLDLEEYYFSEVTSGLVDSAARDIFNPRLSLFLDAQLGSHFYVFGQGRVDRGFDPTDRGARFRMDEYAIRYTPWDDGRFNMQIGKFSAVIGSYAGRHLSWDNPFITAPLPYEGVGSVSDLDAPAGVHDFKPGPAGENYDHLPVVWGPDYSTGLSISGTLGKFDYAAEMKNSAPGARPETWDLTDAGFGQPTFSGRIGYRPDASWNFGLSASRGAYLRREAVSTLPSGQDVGDYHEFLLGQDISWARHHWQIWAEVYEARYEVPRVGNADELAYYLEAKYKFTPQLFGALRWGQEIFANIRDTGVSAGQDRWRVDAAVTWRFTAHLQGKVEYSLQHGEPGADGLNHLIAAQVTLRF
jgi:hypothetical protein